MCFRCKKQRSCDDCEGKPKHMSKQFENSEENKEVAGSEYKLHLDNRKNGKKKANNTTVVERIGDWTC